MPENIEPIDPVERKLKALKDEKDNLSAYLLWESGATPEEREQLQEGLDLLKSEMSQLGYTEIDADANHSRIIEY